MNEKQKAILKWLGGEQNIGKQKMLNKDRVKDSGEWILEWVEYNKWLSNRESALICSGFSIYVPVYMWANHLQLVLENRISRSSLRLNV